MMIRKLLLFCCFFIISSAIASQTSEVAYKVLPFVIVYKNGTVERLKGNEFVPPTHDSRTGVLSKDLVVCPTTGVSARFYKPKDIKPHSKIPLLIFFHGGAFFIQSPFSPLYHNFLNTIASEANVIAISVHYRRAPEYPLPIAYDDCWAVLNWVASQSTGHGTELWLKEYVDFERVFVAGDSAGANIAHNMGMRLGSKKLNGVEIKGIVLLHPYFWGKHPIGGEPTDAGSREMIKKWWLAACPSSTRGLDDPLINPLMDSRLSSLGCNRLIVFVAGNDTLRYRGLYYCEALKKSGWVGDLEIMESEGESHVFFLRIPHSEKAIAVVKRVVAFIHQQ